MTSMHDYDSLCNMYARKEGEIAYTYASEPYQNEHYNIVTAVLFVNYITFDSNRIRFAVRLVSGWE